MSKYFTVDVKISYGEESSDVENSDEENSGKEIYNKEYISFSKSNFKNVFFWWSNFKCVFLGEIIYTKKIR